MFDSRGDRASISPFTIRAACCTRFPSSKKYPKNLLKLINLSIEVSSLSIRFDRFYSFWRLPLLFASACPNFYPKVREHIDIRWYLWFTIFYRLKGTIIPSNPPLSYVKRRCCRWTNVIVRPTALRQPSSLFDKGAAALQGAVFRGGSLVLNWRLRVDGRPAVFQWD
jgi:hypothetical protein